MRKISTVADYIATAAIVAMDVKSNDFHAYLIAKAFHGDMNPHEVPPTFAYGEEEVYEMIKKKHSLEDTYAVSDDYIDTGDIYGFIDTADNSFFAMWDRYGMFNIDMSEILFETTLIPINLDFVFSGEDLNHAVEYTPAQLQKETEKMKKLYRKPLFLLCNERLLGNNTYTAWSLVENKPVLVTDYKSWRKEFTVISIMDNQVIPSEEYDIIPVSKDLIKALKLDLNPSCWEKLYSCDTWEPRPLLTGSDEDIPESCLELYHQALHLANKARQKDLGHYEEFERLENRLERLERLLIYEAPEAIVKREIEMLKDIVATLSNVE